MDQTTTEQLLNECYHFGKLGHNTYQIMIMHQDDGTYYISMYPHNVYKASINEALYTLKEELKKRAKSAVERDIVDAREDVQYKQEKLDESRVTVQALEVALAQF